MCLLFMYFYWFVWLPCIFIGLCDFHVFLLDCAISMYFYLSIYVFYIGLSAVHVCLLYYDLLAVLVCILCWFVCDYFSDLFVVHVFYLSACLPLSIFHTLVCLLSVFSELTCLLFVYNIGILPVKYSTRVHIVKEKSNNSFGLPLVAVHQYLV